MADSAHLVILLYGQAVGTLAAAVDGKPSLTYAETRPWPTASPRIRCPYCR